MTHIIYIILQFAITFASSAYMEFSWTSVTSMSGRYTAADQLFKMPANTVSHCAALCQITTQCSSFFLNPRNSECFGNKNPFIDHALTSAEIGYVHYKKEVADASKSKKKHSHRKEDSDESD